VGPLVNVILGGVPSEDAGAASGVLNTVNIVAGAVGIALLGIVFFGRAAAHTDPGKAPAHTVAASFSTAIVMPVVAVAGVFFVVLLLTFALPRGVRPESH
jgi:hypothetical protein